MTVNHDVRTSREQHRVPVHEHGWRTESAHRTSLGLVRYVICAGCGGRRVDLQPHPEAPPKALSVAVSPP